MLARQDRPGWRCKVKQREYDNRYKAARYRRLIAEGMCALCGQQEPVAGVRCFDCVVKQLDRNDKSNALRIR